MCGSMKVRLVFVSTHRHRASTEPELPMLLWGFPFFSPGAGDIT
jgi:hypothetical protein